MVGVSCEGRPDSGDDDGVHPTTTLGYEAGQVTQVDYTKDSSGGVFEFDFAY